MLISILKFDILNKLEELIIGKILYIEFPKKETESLILDSYKFKKKPSSCGQLNADFVGQISNIKRELKIDKFSNLPNNDIKKRPFFYSDVPCFVPFLDTNTLINFRYDKG